MSAQEESRDDEEGRLVAVLGTNDPAEASRRMGDMLGPFLPRLFMAMAVCGFPLWIKHLKRGGIYAYAFRGAKVQASRPITEEDTVGVYVAEDGTCYVRLQEEMTDGRFVPVETEQG
jgi:hypothetical protein